MNIQQGTRKYEVMRQAGHFDIGHSLFDVRNSDQIKKRTSGLTRSAFLLLPNEVNPSN